MVPQNGTADSEKDKAKDRNYKVGKITNTLPELPEKILEIYI